MAEAVWAIACVAAWIGGGHAAVADTPRVTFARGPSRLAIAVDGRPLAQYVWDHPEIRRPFFADLRAPDGTPVTRNLPPIPGVDAVDHPTMHPGLWLAFGDLSGADFWRNKGIVHHAGFVEEPKADADGGRFAVRNTYRAEDAVVCEEVCRIRIIPRPEGILIDWRSEFSGPAEFTFGDQEEMGLGLRVATPLAVKHGGRLVTSEGLQGESQARGQPADWCDVGGVVDGRTVGILVMADPANFRRPWLHARDYGLLVANPFGRQALTRGQPSAVTVRPGDRLGLGFGILVYAGAIDPRHLFDQYKAAISRPN